MGFPSKTMASVAAASHGFSTRNIGLKSIPTETKKSTANASRIGSASDAARERKIAPPDDHSRQERAERHGRSEELGGADGDGERRDQNGEREELARMRLRNPREQPWDGPPANDESDRHERHELDDGEPSGKKHVAEAGRGDRRGEHDENEHREDVFDDEPAHADVPDGRVKLAPFDEQAHEHDRARDRKRDAEDDGPEPFEAESVTNDRSDAGRGEREPRRGRHARRVGPGRAPRGETAARRRTRAR